MTVKTVIIVDDEMAARSNLKAVIKKFDQLKIVAEASNGQTAIERIETLKPDIVFLDIEMPEVNGFDVAWETEHLNYQLVFSTAYAKYALDAFNTKAIDYLVKPVRPELIEKCINKILNQEELVSVALKAKKSRTDTILLSDGCSSRLINRQHICYVEGIGRYRRLHLTHEGKQTHKMATIVSDTTLEEFDEQLPDQGFKRVHRSFIVNVEQILNIRLEGRRHFLVLKDCEDKISVSRSQYKELKMHLAGR